MEKEFVPYTEAIALKELGFDEKCYGYFTRDEEFFYFDVDDLSSAYTKNMDNLFVNSVNGLECTAPLYQQTFRWFREKYNAVCEIIRKEDGNHSEFIGWVFINNRKIDVVSYWDSKTYEEAELECLKKLIELVKEK